MMNDMVIPPRAPIAASRRALGAVLVVVALTLLGLLAAGPAGAHAALESMSPDSGATLQDAPSEVVLEFNENVSTTDTGIRVFDPSGRELTGIDVSATNSTVTATLPELTTDGSYTVDWKVVSADGHPIRGAYLFHLRTATLTEPIDAGTSGAPLLANAMRALGATVALLGLVAVLATALRSDAGRRRDGTTATPWWIRWRWVAVVDGALLMFVGALAVVGASMSESFEVTVDTTSGKVALAAIVLALLGLISSLVPAASRLEAPLAIVTLVAVALQGHAVSLPPVALSASLTLAHIAAAVTWGVGLVWLERRTRTAPASEVRRNVERLSPFAMGAVVVLALTGAVLIFDRVPLDQLLSSTYGRLGLVKLVLLAATVVVAFRNRSMVTPELPLEPDAVAGGLEQGADDGAAVQRLGRGVRVEMVLLAIALVAGAALSQISPPEDDGSAGGGLFTERAAFGDGEVELTVEPGARGTNEVHVVALDEDGRLMADVTELALSLRLESDDVGPLEPEMQLVTPGHSLSYAEFPFEGEWSVEVTARLGKFEALKADFEVPIGPR